MAKKQKIGQVLNNRFRFAYDQQTPIFDEFARYRQLFKSKITDTQDYPWDYHLFNPFVFTVLRNFLARTVSPNIGVTLQAWNEESRPKTDINQKLIEWELNEVGFFLKIARHVFQSALYGRGYLQTGWKYQKEKVIEEEQENGKTRSVVMYPMINRTDLDNLRVFDLFVANRNIADLQKQSWIIIRHWRTMGEMKKINDSRQEDVYNLKKVKDKNLFVRFVDYGRDVMFNDSDDFLVDAGLMETWEMWDKDSNKVTEIVGRHPEYEIRHEDNPFWHGEYPILDTPFFPEDDEYFSSGIVRPIEDLQMGLNSVLNQYLTNARQQLNNMWMTSDTHIPDWEFISRPNGVIHVKGDIKNLREVAHKDITAQAMQMMGEIKTDIQRATGISDFLAMGLPQKGAGAKGAAALNMEEQNLDQNLKLFMTILEKHTLVELTKQFLRLNTQFITDEQTIKIVGRHGYKHLSIKPDEVSNEFDPIVIPNSVLPKNPMIKLQNLINIKSMADREQKVQINTVPIWRSLIELIGETDLDEIVPDDREEALEENELLLKGQLVEVEASDNHKMHNIIHQHLLLSKELTKDQVQAVMSHINDHKTWELSYDENLLEELGKRLPVDQLIQQIKQSQPQTAQAQQPQQFQSPSQKVPFSHPAVNTQGLVRQQGQQLRKTAQPIRSKLPIQNTLTNG